MPDFHQKEMQIGIHESLLRNPAGMMLTAWFWSMQCWHDADCVILAHAVRAVQGRILRARRGVDHDRLYLSAFMYLAKLIASWRNSGFSLLSQILLWRYGERFLNEILILRSRSSGCFSAYFHSSLFQGHLARDWFLNPNWVHEFISYFYDLTLT